MKNSEIVSIKKISSYFLASGIAAIVNVLSRIIYSLIMNFTCAVVLAYLTGMCCCFWLTSRYTFTERATSERQVIALRFFKFFLVSALGLTITVSCANVMLFILLKYIQNYLAFLELFSHLFGMGCSFCVSYVAHSYFTFSPVLKQ